MALPTSLDIYKQSSALLSLAVDVQANIPRAFRASMGMRMADECVDLLVLIGRANAARVPAERVAYIERKVGPEAWDVANPERHPEITGRWYMVTKDGAATLCVDQADAQDEAERADKDWPRMGPHRAVRLVEAA